MAEKVEVRLSAEVRGELEALLRSESVPAVRARRARILLLADAVHPDGRRPDTYIAEVVGCGEKTVQRVRQKFVREGLEPSLRRKPRSSPGTTPIFDGRAEAQLVTLCCSDPPDGRARWTMQLLADECCRLRIVTKVSAETVRRCLKKIGSSPGSPAGTASRRRTAPGSSRTWSGSSTSTTSRSTTSTR